jgi:hypothetical protein
MSDVNNEVTEPRSVRVKRMIEEVEAALQTQTPLQVSTQYAEWQKEFPKIFEMILARTYDRDIMRILIEQFERVERGAKSQHDASVAVGTVLVDRIVKPQLSAAGKKV